MSQEELNHCVAYKLVYEQPTITGKEEDEKLVMRKKSHRLKTTARSVLKDADEFIQGGSVWFGSANHNRNLLSLTREEPA